MSILPENIVFTEKDIINFPEGIPGFESYKKFVIIKIPDHEPFEWLVNVEDKKLKFVIVNPMIIDPSYNPEITKEQLNSLQFDNPESVAIYSIITLKGDLVRSTANFVGPIFINKEKKIGKQIIIDSDKYSVKQPILNK